ncbi:hypothetical protein GCK72_003413 [Caenorhabditis remanei]|uniref:DUF7778 domain-containing protein n=1 Tax=Caenorhabditis remanei TaxID=31234 RepID=A0A6A5HX73_CAERE|nr:hypothetical protein GCK72_003413 [Caenorhabditis remanei]KAF1771586.1 hypothetical protein GCK72_003413 [Caenorhabditis remanei]
MSASNQKAHGSTARTATLHVATRLNKFIPLPPRPKFRLNNLLQRGNVLCFIRSKSSNFLAPDSISQLKMRYLNVTTNGYLIIYEDNSRGLVVDLRQAINVFCNADRFVQKSKKVNYLRCHIKIRLARGNIHLFVREEDVHKWTCAIMRGSSSMIQKPLNSEDDVLMTAIEAEDSGDFEEMSTTSSCYSEEPMYDEDDDEKEEVTEEMETVIEKSIRNPPLTSVRSLCEKMEKDLKLKPKEQVLAEQLQKQRLHSQEDVKKEESFTSEVYCNIPNETIIVLKPTDESERKEEEMEVEREEKWWTRSLRC